ncbi:hypothetical protein [Deinococcus cellulosilyticus]|nr:hypothetical protein [Deinococcus cellulosilyticus]
MNDPIGDHARRTPSPPTLTGDRAKRSAAQGDFSLSTLKSPPHPHPEDP